MQLDAVARPGRVEHGPRGGRTSCPIPSPGIDAMRYVAMDLLLARTEEIQSDGCGYGCGEGGGNPPGVSGAIPPEAAGAVTPSRRSLSSKYRTEAASATSGAVITLPM